MDARAARLAVDAQHTTLAKNEKNRQSPEPSSRSDELGLSKGESAAGLLGVLEGKPQEGHAEGRSAEQLAAAYQQAAEEADIRREKIATPLQAHLSAYVKSLPHATYQEKQFLAKLINAELRPRGLALKCPKTGTASFLQADIGDDPEVGRFQYYHFKDGKQVRTASRTKLPDLEIVLADLGLAPREEQEAAGWAAAEKRRRRAATGQQERI